MEYHISLLLLCLFGALSSSRYADDTTLRAESEEELKSLLMKVKVESEKVGLKLKIRIVCSKNGNFKENKTVLRK